MVVCRGRDAFTNTVETERYREILRKELRVTDRQMKEQAILKLAEIAESRKDGASELETAMRKRSESRRYRPTSASAIGEGYSPAWGEDKGRNMTATVRLAPPPLPPLYFTSGALVDQNEQSCPVACGPLSAAAY